MPDELYMHWFGRLTQEQSLKLFLDNIKLPIMQKEIFLIAHGCNDTKKIRKAINQGVNAIECDLWYDEGEWTVSHDGIVKTDLLEWLDALKKESEVRKFAVVIFDIKHSVALEKLRNIITGNINDQSRIYSIAKLNDAGIFLTIVKKLNANEGIAIDEEDDPHKVNDFFRNIGAERCWYGNGITLIPVNDTYHESMKKAAAIRDRNFSFSKIYTWTVNRKSAMKKYLSEDGVDGLMVDLDGFIFKPVTKAKKLIRSIDGLKLATSDSSLFTSEKILQL
jgi:hypothetical protein